VVTEPMTTLLLVRHATTSATGKRLGGRTQAPLDEAGRAQAQACAERLAGVPLRAVYASPLRRTTETARIVAEPHGLDVQAVDGLLEVEYGRWTDRPLKQVARTKLWPVIQQQPSLVAFPEGETIRQAQLRAVDAIEALVARHKRQVVAAVSHADVIKAIVSFYLGQPLDLFQRIAISPASVTVLELAPGGRPALLRLNDDGPIARERTTGGGRG
jgi:probable phosphomutase (TIGR03848 family)